MAKLNSKQLWNDSRKQQKIQFNTANLLAQGIDPSVIAKTGGASSIDTPGEYQAVVDAAKKAGPSRMEQLRGAEYQWDPNKFLPGIQQQAGAIYDPQQAQMKALQQLGVSQAEEQRLRTQEEFQERMKQEQEAMNRRGAYFSGGAIRGEQDIRNEQMRQLERQDLASQAAYQESLAQQGGLSYEQSQFEKQALFGEEAGAYGRWKGDRDYNYMFETNERSYATQALMGAADSFTLRNQFGLNVAQFEQQQNQFKEDTRRWDEQFAWNKFMYKNAQD